MGSTGISEYSDIGVYSENDLASGQVTPLHKRDCSPPPAQIIQIQPLNSEDGSVTNSEENSSSVVDDTDTINGEDVEEGHVGGTVINGGLEVDNSC